MFNWTVLTASLCMHAATGLVTGEVLRLALIAFPGTLIGAWLGARVYLRLSDRRFGDVVLSPLVCIGSSSRMDQPSGEPRLNRPAIVVLGAAGQMASVTAMALIKSAPDHAVRLLDINLPALESLFGAQRSDRVSWRAST